MTIIETNYETMMKTLQTRFEGLSLDEITNVVEMLTRRSARHPFHFEDGAYIAKVRKYDCIFDSIEYAIHRIFREGDDITVIFFEHDKNDHEDTVIEWEFTLNEFAEDIIR